MKDSGAPKPRKKHARETVEEEATEAITEEGEAERLGKEAKAMQEVVIEAAKAAKQAKEVAKPEQVRRSARVQAISDYLKEVGHTPPRRNLQANNKCT